MPLRSSLMELLDLGQFVDVELFIELASELGALAVTAAGARLVELLVYPCSSCRHSCS